MIDKRCEELLANAGDLALQGEYERAILEVCKGLERSLKLLVERIPTLLPRKCVAKMRAASIERAMLGDLIALWECICAESDLMGELNSKSIDVSSFDFKFLREIAKSRGEKSHEGTKSKFTKWVGGQTAIAKEFCETRDYVQTFLTQNGFLPVERDLPDGEIEIVEDPNRIIRNLRLKFLSQPFFRYEGGIEIEYMWLDVIISWEFMGAWWDHQNEVFGVLFRVAELHPGTDSDQWDDWILDEVYDQLYPVFDELTPENMQATFRLHLITDEMLSKCHWEHLFAHDGSFDIDIV